MKIIFKVFSSVQILILYISCYFFRMFKRSNRTQWVIGVEEIANNIFYLKNIIQPSVSACLKKSKFYDSKYDFVIESSGGLSSLIYKGIYSPILFAYLVNNYTHFWYIFSTGFLLDRDYEFKFLKKHNKKIICMFVGTDIRSPKLMSKFLKDNNMDGFIEYVGIQKKEYLTDEYDEEKKALAASADLYADVIFNYNADQMSYLRNRQYPWPYVYAKENFYKNPDKFKGSDILKVVHAPSNPLVKGTPLVRAAIKKLQVEGYKFEYIELQGVKHTTVLEYLRDAHIVLNQFYAFAPGLFGIEAMANNCAVLMSADPDIETGLPRDSKNAWLITKYWEIYDNLKYLLDHPEKIKYYADNGYNFCLKHYTYEAAGKTIKRILKDNGVIE